MGGWDFSESYDSMRFFSFSFSHFHLNSSRIKGTRTFQSRIDGSATYARPKSNRKRRAKGEKECIETDVYVESNVSACRRSINESAYASSRSNSPRLAQVEATIREEEEEGNEETSRITRF